MKIKVLNIFILCVSSFLAYVNGNTLPDLYFDNLYSVSSVQINNKLFYCEEFFNSEKKTGNLTFKSIESNYDENMDLQLIYDQNNVVYYKDKICNKNKLNDKSYEIYKLFLGTKFINKIDNDTFLIGPSSIVFRILKLKPKIKSFAKCNIFRIPCVEYEFEEWTDEDDNVECTNKIKLYFADKEWRMSKAIKDGVVLIGYSNTYKCMQIFRNIIVRYYMLDRQSEYFEVTNFIEKGCPSLVNYQIDIPRFNFTKYSFMSITYTPEKTSSEQVYFDKKFNLAKFYDSESNFLYTICDYNNGQKYIIDSKNTCKFETTANHFTCSYLKDEFNLLREQLKNSVYLGKTIKRGRLCDIFEYSNEYSISTLYIGQMKRNNKLISYPVSITTLSTTSNKMVEEKNYYNFKIEETLGFEDNFFDITSCGVPLDKQRYIQLTLEKDVKSIPLEGSDFHLVDRKIKEKLLDSYFISPIRVPSVEVEYDNYSNKIFITLLLVEKFSNAVKFEILSTSSYQPRKIDKVLHGTKEECATETIRKGLRIFKWCSNLYGEEICLIPMVENNYTFTRGLMTCTSYIYNGMFKDSKPILEPSLNEFEKTLYDSLELYKNETQNMGEEVTLVIENYKNEFIYIIRNMISISVSEINLNFPSSYQIHSRSTRIKGETISVTNVINTFTDCLNACRENTLIMCQTFSFCQINGKASCVLSKNFLEPNLNLTSEYITYSDELEKDKACDTFSMNFIHNYEKHKGVFKSFSHYLQVDANAVEVCASHCYKDNNCRSFEYCGKSLCYLRNDSGVPLFKATDDNLKCSFYSEKNILKYSLTGTEIVSPSFSTYKVYSIEECATKCSYLEECNSFNYCPKSFTKVKDFSTCELSEKIIWQTKNVTPQVNSFCRNYVKSIKITGKKKYLPEEEKGLKASLFFSLLIFMPLIGGILATLSFIAYVKYDGSLFVRQGFGIPVIRFTNSGNHGEENAQISTLVQDDQ